MIDSNSFFSNIDFDSLKSMFDENNIKADKQLRQDMDALDYDSIRQLHNIFDDEKVKDESPEYTRKIKIDNNNEVLWASLNYGASSPNQVGAYLSYDDCYLIKEQWQGKWKIPSIEDFHILLGCSLELRKDFQDIVGVQVIGNSRSIFIPLSGFKISGKDEICAPNHIFLLGEDKICFHLECDEEIVMNLKRHDRIMLPNTSNIVHIEGLMIPVRPIWV